MRDPPSGRRNHERRATWTLFENRGSTQVLGFALMFAVTMTTFALYQADVVPDQNEEVEFDHNSAMAGEMGELRAAMQDASTSESAASATLQLSPSYPGRAVAVNPPEPAGRLATSDEHPVYVRGLYSTDERFWDGRSVQYATRHLNYSISYNRITGDEYALEQGMLVKKYANGNTRNLTAAPVNGNRISLTLLGGAYDRTAHRESVEFSPVSTTSRSLTITAQRTDIDGDGSKEDPHIWLPTQLNQDEWTDIADAQDELVSAEVKDSGNSDVPAPAGNGDYVKLTLKDGQQYDFRVSRVTLGQPASVTPEYLTASSGTVQIPEGGSKTVTVTVRDKYSNPISGAEVRFTPSDSAIGSTQTFQTGSDGRATYQISPSEPVGGEHVDAEVVDGPGPVKFELQDPSARTGNEPIAIYTGGQMAENLGDVEALNLSEARTVPSSDEDCLLLGDTGGGLLGGLLGALNCDTDEFRTAQGQLQFDSSGGEYQLRYVVLDTDGDDDVTDGDDTVSVAIEAAASDDTVFAGELDDDVANDVFTESGVNLLNESNYESGTVEWDNDEGCYNDCGILDGADQEGHEASSLYDDGDSDGGYTEFDDIDLSGTDSLFVEQALGRVTVAPESDSG